MRLPFLAAFGILAFAPTSRAVILYGKYAAGNMTNPGTGAPWDSVAKVCDAAGNNVTGSAVYLGNGYMMTAGHVAAGTHVFFDGFTGLEADPAFASVTVEAGVDARIFKLKDLPTVAAVNLPAPGTEKIAAASPASAAAAAVTLVGWGVGRDATPVNTGTVGWGVDSEKRWGTNTLNTYSLLAPASQPAYDFLTTHLGRSSINEAGASLYDSGSGLFQQISGTWYLVGLTTLVVQVSGAGTSTFGTADSSITSTGDENIFVRVSSYVAQIQAISAIPEPTTYAAMAGGLALGVAVLRRRQRAKSAANAH